MSNDKKLVVVSDYGFEENQNHRFRRTMEVFQFYLRLIYILHFGLNVG
jgi:hypothetical protein